MFVFGQLLGCSMTNLPECLQSLVVGKLPLPPKPPR